jgi:hypothetical protein
VSLESDLDSGFCWGRLDAVSRNLNRLAVGCQE